MKILHTADLHLGSFPGPEENGVNSRFLDLKTQLLQLFNIASAQQPDLIVIAGDLFHQARVWSSRALAEEQEIIALIRALKTISPLFILRGTPNHDGSEQFATLQSVFVNDPSVIIATRPGIYTLACRNQTVQIAAIPGFSNEWYTEEQADLDPIEANRCRTRDLHNMIQSFYAQMNPTQLRLFCAHFTAAGANMESGQTAFFSDFEPVLDPVDLSLFDLSLLGHIHRPQRLENTQQTYYSGALMQLNFNDENQARGVYLHEIEPGFRPYSQFIELQQRQFHTILLNEDEIHDLLENEYDVSRLAVSSLIPGSILRLRYSVSEEDKARFTPADLQKKLYEAGAFYVAGMSVLSTVDSSAVQSIESKDPQSMFEAWMDSRNVADDDRLRLQEMAEDLISQASQDDHNLRVHGAFLPERIEVTNYRSYAQETFTFDPVRFCIITGSNGAGKSSLFMDAMADALFEKTRENDVTGWISADPNVKSGKIIFDFAVGDQHYRIERGRTKAGRVSLSLLEKQNEGYINISESKAKLTQAKIEQICGFDQELFKSCALIMQDQYDVFLEASSEERMRILSGVLGLSVYENVEAKIRDLLKEDRRTLRDINLLKERIETEKNRILEQCESDDQLAKAEIELNLQRENLEQKKQQLIIQQQVWENQEQKRQLLQSSLSQFCSQKQELEQSLENVSNNLNDAKQASARIPLLEATCSQEPEYQQESDQILQKFGAFQADMSRLSDLETSVNSVNEQLSKLNEKRNALLSEARLDTNLLQKQKEDLQAQVNLLKDLQTQYDTYAEQLPDYEKLQQTVKDLIEKEKELDQQNQKEEDIYLAQKTEIQKRIDMLNNSGCLDSSKAGCLFLKDAASAPKNLKLLDFNRLNVKNQYKEEKSIVQMNLQTIQAQLESHPLYQVDLNTLQQNIRSLQSSESKLYQTEILLHNTDNAKTKLAETNQQIEQLIARQSRLYGEIQTLTKQKQQYLSDQKRQEELTAHLSECRNAQQNLILCKEKATHLSTYTTEISQLHEKLQQTQAKIAELETSLHVLPENDPMLLTEQLKQIQTEQDQIQQKMQSLADDKARLKLQNEQIEKLNGELRDQEMNYVRQNRIRLDHEMLLDAFSPEGIVRMIIESALPELEAIAQDILFRMSGQSQNVHFVTQRKMKSDKKKDVPTLDIEVEDGTGKRLPYISQSGGEKVKSALSVILAVSEMKSRAAGVHLGMLFIDEPPFLDTDGTQAYCDALDTIRRRYPDLKIMAVSHDESFKGRFDQSITVFKDSNGSHAGAIEQNI